MYSSDPDKDFLEYDRQAEIKLSKLPVCAVCGEHIQDETALLLWDEWICNKCILKNTAYVDDYVDDEERWET
jgi:hypothetical protein